MQKVHKFSKLDTQDKAEPGAVGAGGATGEGASAPSFISCFG